MKRSTPRGFTLLELLMVLAVIVVVMSIAAPALQDVLFAQHIKMAGEQLRTDFGRARIMAMKSGRIVSFRFRPDSGAYVIQAVYGSTDDTEIAMDEALGEAIPVIEEELPENIVFQTLAGEANSRDAFVQESLQTNSDAAVLAMSPPILFYPDGTTSTAEVLIRDQNDQRWIVRLRGLTGVATGEEYYGEGL